MLPPLAAREEAVGQVTREGDDLGGSLDLLPQPQEGREGLGLGDERAVGQPPPQAQGGVAGRLDGDDARQRVGAEEGDVGGEVHGEEGKPGLGRGG